MIGPPVAPEPLTELLVKVEPVTVRLPVIWKIAPPAAASPEPLEVEVLPVKVLFVGINPGIRSEAIGHHFAGYSNRFWKLLFEARLVSEPIGPEDDSRLPEWGFGITNLIPRCTPGIDTLVPHEYVDGERALRRKVRRWKPEIVVFVGVTL